MTAPAETTKALWVKCPECSHCWPALYYPLELAKVARMLEHAACPRGCEAHPTLAKQRDGELLEGGA